MARKAERRILRRIWLGGSTALSALSFLSIADGVLLAEQFLTEWVIVRYQTIRDAVVGWLGIPLTSIQIDSGIIMATMLLLSWRLADDKLLHHRADGVFGHTWAILIAGSIILFIPWWLIQSENMDPASLIWLLIGATLMPSTFAFIVMPIRAHFVNRHHLDRWADRRKRAVVTLYLLVPVGVVTTLFLIDWSIARYLSLHA